MNCCDPMFVAVFIFLCVLGYSAYLSQKMDCEIESLLTPVMASIIILLFLASYLGILQTAAWILYALGLIAWLPMLRQIKTNIGQILTPTITVFFLSYIALTFFLRNQYYAHWDEFGYWGRASWLVYLNKGFIAASDQITMPSYPPGAALWHYFFYQFSGYSEQVSYAAHLLLLFAPLCIFTKSNTWKDGASFVLPGFIFAVLIVVVFRPFKLISLYNDNVIAVFLAFGAADYFLTPGRRRDVLRQVPTIIVLNLFKLKLMPYMFWISILIFMDQYRFAKRGFRQSLWIFWTVILGYGLSKLWLSHLAAENIPLAWHTKTSLTQVWQDLMVNPHNHRISTTLHNFVHLLGRPAAFYALITASFVYVYQRVGLPIVRRRIRAIYVYFVIGAIIYLAALLYMYLYVFSPTEGMVLHSFKRYSSVYFLAWALIAYAFFIKVQIRKRIHQTWFRYVSIFLLLCLMLSPWAYYAYFRQPAVYQKSRNFLHDALQSVVQQVSPAVGLNQKVYVIWQSSSGIESLMIHYFLTPRQTNLSCAALRVKHYLADIWSCDLSPAQFRQHLSQFDYLLVAYAEQPFWHRYGRLFQGLKRPFKPIAQYPLCLGKGFNAVRQEKCTVQTKQAYLFQLKDGQPVAVIGMPR